MWGKFGCLGLFLGWASALAQTVPSEDYSQWAHVKLFGLNTSGSGAQLASTVTGFPLLLRLNAANAADIFAGTRAGGADLRFRRTTIAPTLVPVLLAKGAVSTATTSTASAATTASTSAVSDFHLPYEIEHWDSAGQSAAIWVLVDTILPNRLNQQGIAVHWGKADAPARSNPAAVFDSANGFVAVWHMGGSSPTAFRNNAVPGGNPAIPSGANVANGFPALNGLIGLADTLRGGTSGTQRVNDDHFDLGSGYARLGPNLTMSLWFKPASPVNNSWNVYFALGNGAPGDNLTIGRMGGTQNLFSEAFNGSTGSGRTEMHAVLFGQWQLATFTVQGTVHGLHYNGIQSVASRTTEITVPGVNRSSAYLGRSLWAVDPNTAVSIDEVRLHKVARSQDWINLEYQTQKPGSTVLSVMPPPGAPVAYQPAHNAVNVPVFSSLSWLASSSSATTSFRVQLAPDSLFTAPVLDVVQADQYQTVQSRAIGPLLAATSYYWRIRAVSDAGASNWSAIRRFTTEATSGTVPTAPQLSAPAAFAVNVSRTPTLSWLASQGGATSYHVQVATVPNFTTPVLNDSGVAALQRTIGTLSGSTEHYWRVRGRNSLGSGPWSDVRAFTTVATIPAPPSLLAPASFATDVPAGSPTLSWSASPGATTYRVQVSQVSAFTSFVVNDSTVTGTSRTLGTLAGFTDYYWRVNAKNAAGTSDFSLARRFTTGEPVAVLSSGTFVAPVRLQTGLYLRIGLPQGETVTVNMLDARGRLIKVVWDAPMTAGVHMLRLPETVAGLYMLKFRAGAYQKILLAIP